MIERAGAIAVRIINQYRRRDVIPYLALRYYLKNAAARTDHWAKSAAVDTVLSRKSSGYLPVSHFKELESNGKVSYRGLMLPCANEALAEAALLDECARHPEVFAPEGCTYSYRLPEPKDTSGVFVHYMVGLRERHDAIIHACEQSTDGVVACLDLKKFYPSVSKSLAKDAWNSHCTAASLSDRLRSLGSDLIDGDRSQIGLMTGPMFSHLIGNLVLREFDRFGSELPVPYFRYVDDITLVGERDKVKRSIGEISHFLSSLGLSLHDDSSPKFMIIPTSEWLACKNDFRESKRSTDWPAFISKIKHFLIENHEQAEDLKAALLSEGIRLPIKDYAGLSTEGKYLERLINWLKKARFRRDSYHGVSEIVNDAIKLRGFYTGELGELLAAISEANGFDRKRMIPKMRYRCGRLAYLGSEETISSMGKQLCEIPELYLHGEVLKAVSTGDVSTILQLGSNAANSVAQVLAASGKVANISQKDLSQIEIQSLAVFLLNDVTMNFELASFEGNTDYLLKLAKDGVGRDLMICPDPFIREMACLHGLSDKPGHSKMLYTAFDPDEDLFLDATEALQEYAS